MILVKACEVFSPTYLGLKEILIAGGTIVAISDKIDISGIKDIEVINGKGLKAVPGLIDSHVHIAGAGGEGGPATRTPEMQISHMLEAGITTVIGCQGTDGFTRRLESLLMKAKAVRHEGLSAYILTGSYQVPPPTILGDIAKDLAMIEEVIGVGEIALSDHRSSCPTVDELKRIASKARTGGLIGGKAGIVNIHLGDAKDPFRPLYEVVATSQLNIKQFFPTHCNRNFHIAEESKTYGKSGYIDLTAASYPCAPNDELKPSKVIAGLLKAGVPPDHLTISSDGFGSLPRFDENGKLTGLEMGYPKSVFTELIDCIRHQGIELELALKFVTSNVADIFGLKTKGRISTGNDADLLFLDQNYDIVHLIAMGVVMVRDGIMIKKGNYER
ncbi:MAG TPA: beta-aspartyl-peptidase [Bacteroidales bacterium]|nr:beta-aspartyl-peptidase [Bacteroidales bacterium]